MKRHKAVLLNEAFMTKQMQSLAEEELKAAQVSLSL